MQQLGKVYDNNIMQVGEFEQRHNQRITLLPVSHVMQSAQIEILVSRNGDFVSAKVVDKENARTIVPVTLASANRTSTSAPHYIHDKLCYVAGDYVKYGGATKRQEYFNNYLQQMRSWVQDEEIPDRIISIYKYIKKGTIIEDLIKYKILPTDGTGMVVQKWTTSHGKTKPDIYNVITGEVLDAFVRFDVVHKTTKEPVVWEDKQLFDAFIQYLQKTYDGKEGYCYVTGEKTILTTQHGSRVRNAGDMSKLISSNDNSGYTYRGRFSKSTEAVQIGYGISQKSHHALRWLFQRQGMNVDSRYFVTFGVEKPKVVDPFGSSFDFLKESAPDKETEIFTEEFIAEALNRAIQGYKIEIAKEDVENIIVMAVDAATSGRLAIVYYQHLHTDSFLQGIKHWHQTCRWLQVVKEKDTKKIRRFVGTPSTYHIVEAVYGSKADSRIKKELYTRLLPCIVERKEIPKDIVRLIFSRVKNPASFKGLKESWEATLNIACALINKQYEGEGYSLALQEDNLSRDYLFGRLLGVAEVMERRILKNRDEKRATNATRYFNAFSQHPARTWMVIRRQLTPYFERLGADATSYNKLIQSIEDHLTIENMTNKPLGPVFLLGYSSQVQDMYKKKEEK